MRYAPRALTHDEAHALLPSYAAANLDLAEAVRVRAHLTSGCADCLRELFSRPVGLPRPTPRAHAPAPTPAPRRRSPPAMAVACALAAVGLSAWMVRGFQRREMWASRPSRPPGFALEWDVPANGHPPTEDPGPRSAASARRPEVPRAPAEAGPGAAPSVADEGAPPTHVERAPLVTYAYDVLSIRVANAPLTAVLEEVGRQSGATIRGDASGREVSASFERVPLPEALHRLLGERNFLLVYDDQRRPRVVELLSGPPPSRPTEADSPVPADASPSQRVAQSFEQTLGVLAHHRPVALSGALAAALGTEAMPLGQLLDVGVHHADKSVRAAAMRAWVETLEGDEELRSAVLGTLTSMDDAALADLVRGMAGERAEETLFYVATQSNGALRVKAAALLQQMHADSQRVSRADG